MIDDLSVAEKIRIAALQSMTTLLGTHRSHYTPEDYGQAMAYWIDQFENYIVTGNFGTSE